MRQIALFSFILAFIVVVVGAYTRLTDAGLGCPDWPGCYGQLLVPESELDIKHASTLYPEQPVEILKAKTEMFHRYLASTLGLMIVLLFFGALKSRKNSIKVLSFMLFILVIFQGLLGMWTVTLRLLPVVVMGHLLGGLTTLSLLWLLYLFYKHPEAENFKAINTINPKFRQFAIFTLLAVIIQLALGGWTSANYAALACPDFPSCLGQYWPEQLNFTDAFNLLSGIGAKFPTLAIHNDARITIHFVHRLWAIVVCSMVLVTCFALWQKKLVRFALVLLALLTIQLGLGITNVLAQLPLTTAVLHNAVGALLLLALITLNFYLFKAHISEKKLL